MSPIPTRVYKPVTAAPRQTSAMTLADVGLICLTGTVLPCGIVQPQRHTRETGNRSGEKYKSEHKGLWGATTLAAVARPLASPLLFRFSADRVRRNRSTGTCAGLCRLEAALGSNAPRNGGKSDVRPGPWNHFCGGSKIRQ
jgi:hypothetical protein